MKLFDKEFYTDDFDQEMIDFILSKGWGCTAEAADSVPNLEDDNLLYGTGVNYFWTSHNKLSNYLTKQQFMEKIGMTQKQFTKADLKTGMIIEFMNGEIGQVLLNTAKGDIVTGDDWFPLEDRTDEDMFGYNSVTNKVKSVFQPKSNKYFNFIEAKKLIKSGDYYEYRRVWKQEEKSPEQIEIENIQAEMDKLNKRLGELKNNI